MHPKVLVVGSFMMDLIVRTERWPDEGETVVGTEFQRAPGGKGANQAVAAARLGGQVTMVGRVGDDPFGEDQIKSLQDTGVRTDYITVDPEVPTGVGAITLSGKNNRIIIVPGANMRCTVADVERARPALEEADVILLQLEIPLEVSAYVVEEARKMGKTIVFNPAPARPLPEDLLRQVTVLTPNETEAQALTGIPVVSLEDGKKAAKKLHAQGVENVVVTMGEQGCLLVNDVGVAVVPSWPVDVVDTTAAGDTFNGALAVSLSRGLSWESALRFANAAGALAVTQMGAQPSIPTRDAVERFLKERQ